MSKLFDEINVKNNSIHIKTALYKNILKLSFIFDIFLPFQNCHFVSRMFNNNSSIFPTLGYRS